MRRGPHKQQLTLGALLARAWRRNKGRWRGARVLAMAAGLCIATPAMGQFARAVNPDQSVTAEDAMLRVRELGEAGNTGEALRVLQLVLESDADRMLAVRDAEDPNRFESVRSACHRLLSEWPELLARYRAAEEQNARRQLDEVQHRAVQRSRFMTAAGLEATLRVAMEDLEAGRFEAARLRLEECGAHPDARGVLAKDRARMAVEVGRQIGREEVRAWARALAREAGVAEEGNWGVGRAPATFGGATTGLDSQAQIEAGSIAATALNSVSPSGDGMAEAIIELEGWGQEGIRADDPYTAMVDATESTLIAATVGGLVLINDGYTVACLDAATLGVRWRVVPPLVASRGGDIEEDWTQPMMSGRSTEPISSVTAGSGVVVAATRSSGDDLRGGTGRALHGLDVSTGRVLWSLSPTSLDPSLLGAEFDGPVLIADDLAIVNVSRSGLMRRESEVHLAGIDLFRGTARWVRRVGSVGVQPWLRQEARPEAAIVHEGVVYRAADLGVLGAYEASTGRPLWVRRLSTARVEDLQFRVRANSTVRSFQISTPVADGATILCHDPTGNKILRVDARNGKLLGSRDASAFGDVQYMLRVGEHLALVGDRYVSFVKADAFETGLVRMVASRFGDSGIVGRCVVSGESLLVPIAGGVMRVDPKNPDGTSQPRQEGTTEGGTGAGSAGTGSAGAGGVRRDEPTFATARAGNPLVVDLGGGVSTLVVAERSLVSTYLRWEKAQEILRRRATSEPNDPTPLLTMIELGSRAGRNEDIPALSDRVLALADRDPLSSQSATARSRLFALLSDMARKARRVWQEDGSKGAVAPELLSRILGAMGRSAETPEELVMHAFAEAWLHEIRREPGRAIEAYQLVLADPRLANVQLENDDRTDSERLAAPVTSVGRAGPEAARRVLVALRQAGIAAYTGFEDEARRALDGAGTDVDRLIAVADRYPGAMAALEAMSRACDAVAGGREVGAQRDRRVLGLAAKGLELSRAQANAAREEAWPMAGTFLGRVVGAIQHDRPEAALRLVRGVEADKPEAQVSQAGGGKASATSMAQGLVERLRARWSNEGSGPALGGMMRATAQPLEGWVLTPALIRNATIVSRESVLMHSSAEGKLGLWTRNALGDEFVAAWTREARTQRLTPILVTPEETLLLVRPAISDDTSPPVIECIETATGRVRWKSAPMSELMASGDGMVRPRANERFATPMDGQVRGSDVVAVTTDHANPSVWLVGRDGAFAAVRVRTGEVIAKGVSGVSRVYDVDASASRVVIAGATSRPGVSGLMPRVEVRSGEGVLLGVVDGTDAGGDSGLDVKGSQPETLRLNLGDHARFARVARSGDVLIGAANGLWLVGSAPGAAGQMVERWSRTDDPMRSLAGAWMTPDMRTLIAIDAQSTVLTLDPRTGESTRQRPETTSRVTIPLEVVPVRGVDGATDVLAITSANGLVLIGPDGALVGADGITPKGNLALAALGATRAACVELFAGSRDVTGESTGRLRVAMLDLPFARVISTASVVAPGEVSGVVALDDTLLITAGDSTIAIDVPRE